MDVLHYGFLKFPDCLLRDRDRPVKFMTLPSLHPCPVVAILSHEIEMNAMTRESIHPSDFRDLPAWLWLWLPLILLIASYLGALPGKVFYERYFGGEAGIVEVLTLLFLFTAAAFGVRALFAIRRWGDWRLFTWVVLFILGCVYYAGEEASWGQHLAGWDTPGRWADMNDQAETNIHNLTGIGLVFDQLPRNLLTLAVFIGGVVMPLWRRYKRRALDPEHLPYWLWPTMVCLPAAMLAVFISVPEKVLEALGFKDLPLLNISAGETKELYLGLFLMLYILSMNRRLRQILRWRSGQSLTATRLMESAQTRGDL
ncbi:MAG: hypothetical protein ACREQV_06245 [Candidatus Binatia bacterium]